MSEAIEHRFMLEAIHASRRQHRLAFCPFTNGVRWHDEPARERRYYADQESFEKDFFYLSQRFEWPSCPAKQARYVSVSAIDITNHVVWC